VLSIHILHLKPGSTNTVPGFVQFSLDIGTGDDRKLQQLEDTLKYEFEKIAAGEIVDGFNVRGVRGKGCTVEWQLDSVSPAITFNEDCVQCVISSTRDIFGARTENLLQRMTSGAGHDR
jgi:acetylornithine deacetylase/succinyl-diaminopimelate desuccinylase-like protein